MRRVSAAVALLLAAIGLASIAEEPINQFRMIGTLDSIDREHSVIVLNDVQMRLADYTSVRSLSGEAMTLSQLELGMKVGLMDEGSPSEASEPISEIWVLPADYRPAGAEE